MFGILCLLFSDIPMAKTAAERQRQYRARRDADVKYLLKCLFVFANFKMNDITFNKIVFYYR